MNFLVYCKYQVETNVSGNKKRLADRVQDRFGEDLCPNNGS